ncbi:hypothetical protein Tel_05815 [Candidatus Tenderia electrophaga]|jgi:hypothetical protein|uniref:Uncharacterized protein n=1 Tax=Candidatus Tenderia electrophaga TaxID=1748243 RepID=A0A0S2TC15_9GAMM|nr:hypothetical protein Tel_05815 [Candidatus Tenderia electrophaga]
MAEIDNSNPIGPVWPQRPIRRVEDDDKAKDERRWKQQKRRQQGGNNDKKDDGKPHIDEYA